MILRATYRTAGQTDAEPRVVDIEHPTYEECWTAAQEGKREGENLLHVRRPDA